MRNRLHSYHLICYFVTETKIPETPTTKSLGKTTIVGVNMFTQDNTSSNHFCVEEITDIREIIFEDKSLECELLKIERDSYRREAERWKTLYESASNLINKYCRG